MSEVMAGLNDYERQRLEHIRRNQEFMARLGIPCAISAVESACQQEIKPAPGKRRKPPPHEADESPQETRRSGRLAGKIPEFMGEFVDKFGDDDEGATAGAKARKRARAEWSDEDKETEVRQILENSRRWLQESRDALLKLGATNGKAPESADEWKQEAVRRWGSKVSALHMDDWEVYCMSRMSAPPPPSPHDLMQEYYAHDTWQLLICCVLMSRVSSHDVKHNTIAAFFQRYPTPSDALDAEPDDLMKILHPLGLFPTRMRSVVEVSRAFLELPQFEVSLKPPFKIYGIGEFGLDSYLIFTRGDISISPQDKTLKAFVEWQKRNANKKVVVGVKEEEAKPN